MAQFIYTMNRVGKVVPPKRIILRDISLSFFPGAKIGVLGLNGSGKSTLLKIMSGIDKDIEGEARAQAGIKVGYLPQEPLLDEAKTVREVVGEGVWMMHRGLIDLASVAILAISSPETQYRTTTPERNARKSRPRWAGQDRTRWAAGAGAQVQVCCRLGCACCTGKRWWVSRRAARTPCVAPVPAVAACPGSRRAAAR